MQRTITLISLVVLAIGLFAAYTIYIIPHVPFDGADATQMAVRGQFGDQYGGLNTFFSALAFVVLVFSFYVQQQELLKQQREMDTDRKALIEQLNLQRTQTVELGKTAQAQRHAVLAAIANMKIQGFASLIEVEKLRSQQWQTGSAPFLEHADRIEGLVEKMNAVVSELEANTNAG